MDDYASEELERLKMLLLDSGVAESKVNVLMPVIENTAWMKVKLDEARDVVKTSSVVITYDNGGGQKGIRENPIFKGYEALWKSYMSGMSKIIDAIPETHEETKKEELEKPQTMLEIVRARKRA